MTTVEWSEFADFYAAINDGARPFAWQQRLVDTLAETGAWPDVVSAPTGSGKSVPVIAHIFANAAAASTGVRVPRRLVTVVNRRALVDAQHTQALRVQTRLAEAEAEHGTLLHRVRTALEALTPRLTPPRGGVSVLHMRGQVQTDSRWVDDPAACTVIAATPDMWGSRLLFGGYGSGRFARPREAGLLAYDCVAALDETHLNQQLAVTAVRVRELAQQHAELLGVPALQVMRLSATQGEDTVAQVPNRGPGENLDDLALDDADLTTDRSLSERLTRPKPLRYVESAQWPAAGAANKRYVADLVAEVMALRERTDRGDGAAHTVGCIVNRVEAAAEVTAELKKKGLEVRTWVGRMRPYDLAVARTKNRHLFTVAGDDGVDVLVATSTVEVGVDIDLAGLVTELCPGTSLVQRFGRVNRLGRRAQAPLCVVGPPATAPIAAVPPYTGEDLERARAWVTARAADPNGASPWALVSDPAPPATLRRVVLERLEPGIVEMLGATSVRLFTELTLDRWLQDDFEYDREPVLLVPRRFSGPPDPDTGARSPVSDVDLLTLLDQTPVLDAETFPTTIKLARFFVEHILAGDVGSDRRVVAARPGETPTFVTTVDEVKPGGVYVIPDDVRISRDGIVVEGVGREVTFPVFWGPHPRGDSQAFAGWPGAATPSAPGPESSADRSADGMTVGDLVDLTGEGLVFLPGDRDATGVDWCVELAGLDDDALAETLATIEERHVRVVLPPPGSADEDGSLPWVVFMPARASARDEEVRQEWTPAPRGWVTLDVHQEAVGERAARMAERLGLSESVAARLRSAGEHHDDGKRVEAFQVQLREGMPSTTRAEVANLVLAKSGTPRAAQVRNRGRHSVPGWRHEQMSVVWAAAVADVDDPLTLRLVGSSHGRGRYGFAHGAATLLDGTAEGGLGRAAADAEPRLRSVADELFDAGEWERLIEQTDATWGVWGCAYVEAVLRAADGQISEEGS